LAGGAAVLFGCALSSPLACGGDAFTVGDDGGSGSGADGQGSDGPDGGDSGPDGTSLEGGPADAPQEAAPGSVVYVSSTSGDDANDGTDPAKPKKTIAAALTRAQSIAVSPEVHVCKGAYPEKALSLTQTLKLLGAYDCSTWRRTATYGFPSFDGIDATTIQNADPTAQQVTLVVTGAVAPSALIDGFLIEGAASFAGTTAGVETLLAASPVIQNDLVKGGGGTGQSGKPGSIGIALGGTGSPEVGSCVVWGGGGTGNVGSTGVAVGTTGTPYVHDSIVSGGTGAPAAPGTDTASVGLIVSSPMSQANALKNLAVFGADDGATSSGSTIGIDVLGSGIAVDIEACAIRGGTGAGAGTYSAGVVVEDASGTVRVLGDRIDAGNQTGGGATYGVFVERASSLDVHNSEIRAGSTTGVASGVLLVAATSASIVDDTIEVSPAAGAAITIDSGVSGVVVTDDLLLGGNSKSQVAVDLPGCTAGQLAALDYTAFVNFDVLYACGSTTATTVSAMTAALPATVPTAGDIEIASAAVCTTPLTCVPDSSCPGAPSACIPSILGASWTTTDDGVSGLFNGPPQATGDAGSPFKGWSLPPGTTLCRLARSGTPYQGITTDLFGQPRDPVKPTSGAFEYTLAKCL
jgi:hypothetical protein